MPRALRLIAELLWTPSDDRLAEAGSWKALAEQEMDHAPDLLYDSPDTVYRYEIVDGDVDEESQGQAHLDLHVLADELEALAARLKRGTRGQSGQAAAPSDKGDPR